MTEKELGEGTERHVSPIEARSAATARMAAAGKTTAEGSIEDPSRPHILVVEDNADTRTLVNHLLRKSYQVRCVDDADQALEHVSRLRFDAILVDINLGKGKSGEDVLHAIKSHPGYEETPVVAVTAYAMPGDRERFFAEGFDEYVSKPFSKQRLMEALEGVLA